MVDHSTPGTGDDDWDDSGDDLAALDFSVAGDDSVGSSLDAFDHYVVAAETEEGDALAAVDPLAGADEDGDDRPIPVFTVTNPPQTVTVTTYLDGRVHQIDLSSKATSMTEAQLADEILVIAGLAIRKARSAQYAFMFEGMRELGQDSALTRDFLQRDLGLPTPEQATAAQAEVFATRYEGGHE